MNPLRTKIRGFYGIGVYNPKHSVNGNVLYRSAFNFNAAFVFTVGCRYKSSAADTTKTYRHIPLFHYASIDDFLVSKPKESVLVGVELSYRSRKLDHNYVHPERAVYLLGSEDYGVPDLILEKCDHVLQIPCASKESLNLGVAGSILMWDRFIKGNQ